MGRAVPKVIHFDKFPSARRSKETRDPLPHSYLVSLEKGVLLDMSEFQHSIEIQADADRVFEFISSPENMPKFLPNWQKAVSEGSDRIRIEGVANGHRFVTVGEFHLDPDERTMHWSAGEP